MALLKAELMHARQRRDGVSLRERIISRVDLLGALSSLAPGAANTVQRLGPVQRLLAKNAGFAPQRPLPTFAKQRFDSWFDKRPATTNGAPRGKVILWDDCFVRYYEPNIGQAAVRVLEAMGYAVERVKDRACCGRPAFSTGRLSLARDFAQFNASQLGGGETPIVFLEPSCYSMFAEDYRELGVDGATALAGRSTLFEDFVADAMTAEDAATLRSGPATVAVHGHCHAKSLTDAVSIPNVLERIPGCEVRSLQTGCCGMAGSFGQLEEKYELSVKVAEPLVAQVNELPPDAVVVANGTSCRHQIAHLTDRAPKHLAEVLADSLEPRG
jgi:Fe-S oxidoreductase